MNNSVKCIIVSLLIFTGITACLYAEETLSLDAARRQALEFSFSLQQADLAENAAGIEYDVLRYGWYPDLSLSAGSSVSGAVFETQGENTSLSGSVGASLSQLLWDGGLYSLQRKSADLYLQSARTDRKAEVLAVISECDGLYFSYGEALAVVESARAAASSGRKLAEEAEIKAAAGLISRIDLLEVKAELASRESTLLTAEGQVKSASAALGSFLGTAYVPGAVQAAEEYMEGSDLLVQMNNKVSLSVLDALLTDIDTIPQLQQQEISINTARVAGDIAATAYAPSVSLSIKEGVNISQDGEFTEGLTLSVSSSMTIFPWEKPSVIRQAEISLARARLEQNELKRAAVLTVRDAWESAVSAARIVDFSVAGKEYAHEYLREVTELYSLSAAEVTELLDAEALAVEKRTALISSRFNYARSISSLTVALGLNSSSELWGRIRKTGILEAK